VNIFQELPYKNALATVTGVPSYISAFNTDINTINAMEQMIFSLIEGLKGVWFDLKDLKLSSMSRSMRTVNSPSHYAQRWKGPATLAD
jgi:hypothetical protein